MLEVNNQEVYKVGDVFGEWTFLRKLPHEKSTRKWLARCSCGLVRVVFAANLTTGKSKSCGSCAAKKREAKKRVARREAAKRGE